MTTGLTVLAWSPRVAPGLLSAQAWDVLRSADAVLARTEHPLAVALAEGGIDVEMLEAEPWSDAAAAGGLTARARERAVVWLPGPDGDPSLVALLHAAGAEVVVGSHDLPGGALIDLVAVMDRLRSPGGCAWDAEQTHRSLVTYLVEETYETLEAIETDDLAGLREELGDLLLQVVFHARIGQEHSHDAWSVDDVARGITAKLVRRHPHVFGDERSVEGRAVSAEELEGRWDRLKAAEKGRTSATDGVPMGQPALSLAAKLHDRAARAGVAPHVEVDPALAPEDEAALGELLLGIVVLARRSGLDPEAALRAAARAYADRIRAADATP